MPEDANLMNVVKHSLITKACRGRYINVRGLLRDIQLISDFDADATSAEATQKQLIEVLTKAKSTSDDRVTAIEKKLDALIDSLSK
tara:strand:- start:1246 stop:1503 length:258 start_codon:yes stop_codon:yes gene_type:complete